MSTAIATVAEPDSPRSGGAEVRLPRLARAGAWIARFRTRRSTYALLGALLVLYSVFVFAPIVGRLAAGQAFGGDLSEYLLAGQQGVLNSGVPFHYNFPLLPLLYLPLGASGLSFSTIYGIADLLSGAFMVGLFVAAGALGYAVGRTPLSAGTAAVIVGTFALVISEVGWGGQAQLVAFALGAVAVATLLGVRAPAVGPRARWIAGSLLAVAILAEPYSGAYFVLFALATALLLDRRRVFEGSVAISYLPLVAFPGAAFALTWWAGGSALIQSAGSPILPYALQLSGWQTAYADNGFGSPVNMLGYLVLLAALAIFVVWGRRLDRREGAAVVGAVVACLVQVLLVTPSIYWDRAPFFVVFPVAVVVALLSAEIPRTWPVRSPTVRPASTVRPPAGRGWRSWVRVGAAVVAVAVVLGQSAVAVEIYPAALGSYGVPLSGLASLTWLRGQTGSTLVVAPESEVSPIAYATQLPEFPAVQPYWFDTHAERAASILADTLITGTTWISAGPLTIVQAGAPHATYGPSLLAYRAPYIVSLGTVFEEESGEFAQLHSAVPAPSIGRSVSDLARPSVNPTLFLSDRLPTYNVASTAWFGSNGSVNVNLTFVATGQRLPSVGIGLDFEQAILRAFATHGAQTTADLGFGVSGTVGEAYTLNITATGSSEVALSAPVESDRSGNLTLTWNASPVFGFTGSQFNLTLTIGAANFAVGTPALVTEAQALAANGIRWVVVSPSVPTFESARIADDTAFSLVQSNDYFDVYRVA